MVTAGPSLLRTDDLARLREALSSMAPACDDSERIDRIRLLEELKAAAAAAQIVAAVDFDRSQRTEHPHRLRASDRPEHRAANTTDKGIPGQLALALRSSPWFAQRWLNQARILVCDLPATFAELRTGRTTERRALLVARETGLLLPADRSRVDAAIATRLTGWGDRQVEAEARRAVYRLDPAGSVERTRNAESDRRVGIRPAPDTMCRLSALLPVAAGVAAYAALSRAASAGVADGDARGRGQLMADTLIERLTGQQHAAAVPVEVVLVMSDAALLDSDDEPALLLGLDGVTAEPVPAGVARRIALGVEPGDRHRDRHGREQARHGREQTRHRHEQGAGETSPAEHDPPRWIRRLYADPSSGRLVAAESGRREFTALQRRFLHLRDQHCRTPWCGAPIRHADHVRSHHDGGPTALTNAQGLCAACNYAKQSPGWQSRVDTSGAIVTETPTGHRYVSREPDPPRRVHAWSPVERRLYDLLTRAA